MRWYWVFVPLVCVSCAQLSQCPTRVPTWSADATVVRIVDGDTLVVRTAVAEEKVRIKGIDCPESRSNPKCQATQDCEEQIPAGKRATAALTALAPAGAEIVLVSALAQEERDRYGRLLAYVDRDGVDLGLKLVRAGLCRDFSAKYPHPRMNRY